MRLISHVVHVPYFGGITWLWVHRWEIGERALWNNFLTPENFFIQYVDD